MEESRERATCPVREILLRRFSALGLCQPRLKGYSFESKSTWYNTSTRMMALECEALVSPQPPAREGNHDGPKLLTMGRFCTIPRITFITVMIVRKHPSYANIAASEGLKASLAFGVQRRTLRNCAFNVNDWESRATTFVENESSSNTTWYSV